MPKEDTQFKPGQSGNPAGRGKGARTKLGEAFLEALHNDFQEHGKDAIKTVRQDKPDAYLKTIAMILPKEFKVTVDPLEELTDAELDRYIKQLASALALEVRAGEGATDQASAPESQQTKPIQTLQ